MEYVIRKRTSLNLNADLLNRLKAQAKEAHVSLNSYVENILMDVVSNNDIPNQETMEAIREAREGKYAGVADTSSMEAFIKSCSE